MRTIRRTSAFKRDYKRERKGRKRKTIDDDLLNVVTLLVNDERWLRVIMTIPWSVSGKTIGIATSDPI